MRVKAVFLFLILVIAGTSQAAILDQSQEQMSSTSFVISPDWSIAQTFTAGLSGQLEQVDLYLKNYFDPDLYPSTVSIVNTIDGVPSGSVLGTIYADTLIEGWNSIDFLCEDVLLFGGIQYGIVLNNDDPELHAGPSTQWGAIDSDVYAGGAPWSYTDGEWTQEVTAPGGGPVETFYDKEAAFRTWMVPEPATLLLVGIGAVILRKMSKKNK